MKRIFSIVIISYKKKIFFPWLNKIGEIRLAKILKVSCFRKVLTYYKNISRLMMLPRTVTVISAITFKKVVWSKSQMNCAYSRQYNTDLVSVEESASDSVLFMIETPRLIDGGRELVSWFLSSFFFLSFFLCYCLLVKTLSVENTVAYGLMWFFSLCDVVDSVRRRLPSCNG